jgi:hypothetical protein
MNFPIISSKAETKNFPQNLIKSWDVTTDDPDIVIVLILLADGSNFIGSKRRINPKV